MGALLTSLLHLCIEDRKKIEITPKLPELEPDAPDYWCRFGPIYSCVDQEMEVR